jgi:hypothetical protein
MENDQEKTLIVMRNGQRTIRFDVGEDEAMITGLVGKTVRQAEAPVEVAREFCAGLIDKDWERDEIIEQALKNGFQRAERA